MAAGGHPASLAAALDDLVLRRYGRGGDILKRGYKLSALDAGYATGRFWWNLDDDVTSFQTAHVAGRLDLVFRDLLDHPEERSDQFWAARYGYASPSAVSRAFMQRFGL